MRTNSAGSLMLAVFIAALGAGVAGGMLLSRATTAAQGASAPGEHSPLSDELKLSAEQRDRMRAIWEQARDKGRSYFEEAQSLQRGRDEALIGLLSDQQKAQYEVRARQYADQFADLAARRDAGFAQAVEQTRAILDSEQRLKYEHILRTRGPGPGVGGKDLLPPPVIHKAASKPKEMK